MWQIVVPRLLCTGLVLGMSRCLVSGQDSPSLPDIEDKQFIDDCVKMHNSVRSTVKDASDMLFMTWDEGLATTARAWSRKCDVQHNIYLKEPKRVHPSFSSVGENIWTGYPTSIFSVQSYLNLWVAEVNDYSNQSNTCMQGKICGHYTQVVWASSYKVGCAVNICPNGVARTNFPTKKAAIFVCNYAPAGNVAGRRPYKTGVACSDCEGETAKCQGNLCRNPERDAQKSYSWTPDWDNLPVTGTTCGPSCVSILVIRPLALLLTFLSAYGAKQYYPDIFFYE
uniref:Glioma pathogenesis-related protein 1 n=1 Tax=Osmerus mordax TaxID=8014 RepID=C1BLT0_OSMMO|nr:Glioma pathogenesis-related protein 1 precursor [Osmerus mordax]